MIRGVTFLLISVCQIWLVVDGVHSTNKIWNPILLLAASLILTGIYFYALAHPIEKSLEHNRGINFRLKKVFPVASALLTVVVVGLWLKQNFQQYADPVKISDVIPQIEALCHRFLKGEQPYYPLPLAGYAPFPVYMPLHWLPVGLTDFLGIDSRWIGYIFFSLALIFITLRFIKMHWSPNAALILFSIPLLTFYGYHHYAPQELGVSFDIIIAAYYMVLAFGLYSKNLTWITCGLVLCILSRYTLFFWLPVFACLLFQKVGLKKSAWVWGTVLIAGLVFYVFPFLLRDPSILFEGVRYHNQAATDDWHGYGESAISWTQENGTYFGYAFKQFFSGDAALQVAKMRGLQGGLMILLSILAWFFYQKKKKAFDVYQYNLGVLYLFIVVFFLFSPLTYRYYWLTVFALNFVMGFAVFPKTKVRV